ncbi:hypothetical protein DOTSEDRAFT_71462 [Dothistroma septosporum NZE10]|uniref:Protein kinase domain-containing protein n=1 Tax=Dothistroma septosporum (strain NZE10 / CBS 128990) TaxID=675120 RepID=N1PQW7_DOTSN|nr:hypothetical protein DOTSEDRAFT_71462 [Dothistroma septosporum NZE10]
MGPASRGEPSQPAALSSASPKSRPFRQVCNSEDGPSPSAQQSRPTTAGESLLARHLSADQDHLARQEQAESLSPRRDVPRIHSPKTMNWLIGSPSEDRLDSMIRPCSRRTRSPENRSPDLTATPQPTVSTSNLERLPTASLTSASTISPNDILQSPQSLGSMADSVESIAQKLIVSPQTIPEASTIHHSLPSPLMSPSTSFVDDPLSRHSSTRSMRMPRSQRGPPARRSSRRSESSHTSSSPAQAFLSGWGRTEEPPPEPKPDDEGQSVGLNNEYVIGRTINRGGFGVIKEVHSIDESGRRTMRAVKIVRKAIQGVSETLNEKAQQECEHEVSIWRYLKHRHVLMLHAVYETDFATFCVMDLNMGGTLFDLVRKARKQAAKENGRRGLEPHLAKSYAFQLACALRYLHEDIRVCHRDVKLENCLIDMSAPNADEKGGNLRICDFGLADFLHSSSIGDDEPPSQHFGEHLSLSTELPVQTAPSIIGTLEYASPRGLTVNRKLFETAGDVWAFGVVAYALCTGTLPFKHAMPSKTAELILRADWDEAALRDAAAGGPDVIDLVKGCLEKDLDIRLTISDALRSPWFAGCQEELEEETSSGGWK